MEGNVLLYIENCHKNVQRFSYYLMNYGLIEEMIYKDFERTKIKTLKLFVQAM